MVMDGPGTAPGFFRTLDTMESPLEYTANEAIALAHEDRAIGLRKIADHVEEHEYTAQQIIAFLREFADESEAQSIVVELRDNL